MDHTLQHNWVRNCWYVMAWEQEIPEGGLLARTVLQEPLVVWKTQGGDWVAMADRCCHRLAPLSEGRREGDALRCGYHGLLFNAAGKCIEIPGSDRISERVCVKTYPVVNHNKWICVWMGDAEPDPTMLPDNAACNSPAWQYKPGYLHYDTPYLLICDNLLDFSHLSYVHANTLGGTTAIAQAPAKVEKIPHGIRVTREVPNVPPSAFWKSFQTFSGPVDRYFIYDFVLPGTLLMRSGGRPVGQDPNDPRGGVELISCQTLTPETATTTHYFFQQSHRHDVGDAQTTETIFKGLLQAFEEDRHMITAQYQNILASPTQPMLGLHMDAALVQFRRLVQQTIERDLAT